MTDVPRMTACPYLGLRDDPDTHFTYPSTAQGCHSTGQYQRIDLATQATRCLAAAYAECPRYRAAQVRLAGGRAPGASGSPGSAGAAAVRQGATVQLADLVARAAEERSAPPRRRRGAAAIGLAAVIVAGVAIGLTFSLAAGGFGGGAPGPSGGGPLAASAAPASAPAPTHPPTASPARTPSPSPSEAPPSPSPTAEPPSPTPKPTRAPRTHVVARGETLSMIAAKYGVTVQAIVKANGIKNPSLIVTGTVLIIP